MSKHRPNRLAETLKEEISQLIRVELKDPRIGFVTLTSVDVADDLSHAKVYISVLGTEDEGNASLDALNRAAGYVRSEIGKRVRLRHVPSIVFKYDPSIQHGAHIAKLLKDVGVSDETGKEESHE
ncbi:MULTISPECIES: 30S ribosome-binding factor RbfA [Desulfosporosinus]|uniref:Ribosome-binding factor A n=1 Tax=Desulfosporosinus lacus DSM 15449 TaxID=1121420 RepID=A0A1M6C1M6_9FIRM|nr:MULTISPECIES: 30S ribosome-binding factor RbfA [Desulfosporosinus]MCO5388682.1 30S ribosome-binding factor RbfA [Desulfosporosinus sp.]MDA8221912.1 30S ribosome-binding factor RbfA [Desulfitobacterium hafniense]SHI54900.1 ribosome-binding factor A [Desulfosporosinus lacus DSM 15449]